jgi:hypothetical protein
MSPVPSTAAGTRINEQCGPCDTHSGKVCVAEEKRLDRHKKEPRPIHVARVLQVVASACRLFDPGGVHRGDGGAARIGLSIQILAPQCFRAMSVRDNA